MRPKCLGEEKAEDCLVGNIPQIHTWEFSGDLVLHATCTPYLEFQTPISCGTQIAIKCSLGFCLKSTNYQATAADLGGELVKQGCDGRRSNLGNGRKQHNGTSGDRGSHDPTTSQPRFLGFPSSSLAMPHEFLVKDHPTPRTRTRH